MNNLTFKNKTGQFDLLKGFLIFFILIVHTISSWSHEAGLLIEYKASFLLGCFFFISGYNQKQTPSWKFIKKQTKQLLIPGLLIMVAGVGIYFAKAVLKHESLAEKVIPCILSSLLSPDANDSSLLPFKILPSGSQWYLWTLFWSSIILNELLKIKKEKIQILVVVFISLAGVVLRVLPFWFWQIPQAFSMVAFLYLGYLWNKYKLFGYKPSVFVTLLFILLSIATMAFTNSSIGKNYWEQGLLSYLGAMIVTITVMMISMRIVIKPGKIADSLYLAGRYSLWIFCVNGVDFATVQMNNIIGKVTDSFALGLALHLVWAVALSTVGCIVIRECQNWLIQRRINQMGKTF